jgi:hypothetical protein
MRPDAACSRSSMPVITYPDTTKKTSGPVNPPCNGMPAWYIATISTAMARSP